jgi:hypothetical protein
MAGFDELIEMLHEQNERLLADVAVSHAECARLQKELQRIANAETVLDGLAPGLYGHARAIARAALAAQPNRCTCRTANIILQVDSACPIHSAAALAASSGDHA